MTTAVHGLAYGLLVVRVTVPTERPINAHSSGERALVRRVLPVGDGEESSTVLDDEFAVIEPIETFLANMTDIERSPTTIRSYAFDLRDYFTFLCRHQIMWTSVGLEDLDARSRLRGSCASTKDLVVSDEIAPIFSGVSDLGRW